MDYERWGFVSSLNKTGKCWVTQEKLRANGDGFSFHELLSLQPCPVDVKVVVAHVLPDHNVP